MNFDVSELSPAGEGDLRRRVAALAKKLQAAGLMDQARKRPLPPLPQKIGLVTSPNGAAVHDVLRTLRRRYPLAQVQLAGVQVEGPQAPQAMMMAMKTVVDAGCELVLLVRGGGSFEDLMPFNDEKLAITISRCPVPVVTGIGHEPDTSIADMVADLRCSTPTAAAEAVSADVGQLRSSLDGFGDSMQGALRRLVDVGRLKLERLESRPVFTDSHALLGGAAQTLDLQQERLRKALPRNIERDASGLENARRRLGSAGASLVAPSASSFSFAQQSLLARGRVFSECFDAQWRLRASRLNDLSPLAVLGRGYSLTRTEEGEIVRSVEQAPCGSHVQVQLAEGALDCEVQGSSASAHTSDSESFEPMKIGENHE